MAGVTGKLWPDAEALVADGVEHTAAGHRRPGSGKLSVVEPEGEGRSRLPR